MPRTLGKNPRVPRLPAVPSVPALAPLSSQKIGFAPPGLWITTPLGAQSGPRDRYPEAFMAPQDPGLPSPFSGSGSGGGVGHKTWQSKCFSSWL